MARPRERPPNNIYQKIAIDNEIVILSYLHYHLLEKYRKDISAGLWKAKSE